MSCSSGSSGLLDNLVPDVLGIYDDSEDEKLMLAAGILLHQELSDDEDDEEVQRRERTCTTFEDDGDILKAMSNTHPNPARNWSELKKNQS
jgi:hypothetical protein